MNPHYLTSKIRMGLGVTFVKGESNLKKLSNLLKAHKISFIGRVTGFTSFSYHSWPGEGLGAYTSIDMAGHELVRKRARKRGAHFLVQTVSRNPDEIKFDAYRLSPELLQELKRNGRPSSDLLY